MNPMSRSFVTALERYVARHHLPLVQFRSGERKDAVMAEHLGRFGKDEGVVFIGKAQEKTKVLRTEKRLSPTTGKPYPWIVRSTAMVNHTLCLCSGSRLRPVLPQVLLLLSL